MQGDGKSLSSFTVRMTLAAPDADTPWGAVSGGRFTARLLPADTNGALRVDLNLEAADAQTPWAAITNFQMAVRLASSEAQTNLIQGELSLSAKQAHTDWAHGSNVVLSADWVHSITNPVPVSGRGRLRCDEAESKWGSGRNFELTSLLSLPDPATLPDCNQSWCWWTNIHPYALAWRGALQQFNSSRLSASNIACAGTWRAPNLGVTNLAATIYNGQLEAGAELDVSTRRLNARLKSNLDPQKISPVLTEAAHRWLDQFTWNSTPQAEGRIALTLPAWTNQQPNWSKEVQPTLNLSGSFVAENGGSYRRVQVTSARSHFSYSNMSWHLPNLVLSRPEGLVIAEHRANDQTKDFYWHITSSVAPAAVRHLLEPGAQKGFDLLALPEPPVIEAEVWGRSRVPELTLVKAAISLTNFSFRGESASGLQTAVNYTNKVLQFLQPRLQRGEQRASAEGITADFNAQSVYITNGFSTFEPMVIARAIGPKIGAAIESYVFSNPPVAHVEGTIPMHGEAGADLRFQVEGGPFHWWKFNTPWIAGRLHWSGLSLSLRNVRAKFYEAMRPGSPILCF